MFLVGGLVGWPLSLATFARDEPPFVLSLAWLAIIIEGYNALQVAHDSDNRDDTE